MMMKVIGSASSSSTDDCTPMLKRFGAEANRGATTEKTTSSPSSRQATPGMASARAITPAAGFAAVPDIVYETPGRV
mgnify:CR=1 FL=1